MHNMKSIKAKRINPRQPNILLLLLLLQLHLQFLTFLRHHRQRAPHILFYCLLVHGFSPKPYFGELEIFVSVADLENAGDPGQLVGGFGLGMGMGVKVNDQFFVFWLEAEGQMRPTPDVQLVFILVFLQFQNIPFYLRLNTHLMAQYLYFFANFNNRKILFQRLDPNLKTHLLYGLGIQFFTSLNHRNQRKLWWTDFAPTILKFHWLVFLKWYPILLCNPIVAIIGQIFHNFSFAIITPIVYNQIFESILIIVFILLRVPICLLIFIMMGIAKGSFASPHLRLSIKWLIIKIWFRFNVEPKLSQPLPTILCLEWINLHLAHLPLLIIIIVQLVHALLPEIVTDTDALAHLRGREIFYRIEGYGAYYIFYPACVLFPFLQLVWVIGVFGLLVIQVQVKQYFLILLPDLLRNKSLYLHYIIQCLSPQRPRIHSLITLQKILANT